MREIRAGDVLVVVRLDRLARSVSHLLEVIDRNRCGCPTSQNLILGARLLE
jgi:hypothetical protein